MVEVHRGECPVDHRQIRGAKLGNATFEEVDRMFPSLHADDLFNPRPVRTYRRESRKPIQIFSPRDENNQVVSRFTPDQFPYIVTTSAYLNGLANGKVFKDGKESTVRFSQRVVDNFYKQKRVLRFGDSLIDSTDDLIDDFAHVYPNLVPALHAMFTTGGAAAGLSLYIKSSYRFLEMSKAGYDCLGDRSKNDNRFVQVVYSHESRCVSTALAKTLEQQSAQAALELAKEPISSQYKIREFYSDYTNVVDGWNRRVSELYDQARNKMAYNVVSGV